MHPILTCPISREHLSEIDRNALGDVLGEEISRVAANRSKIEWSEVTDTALLRQDGEGAYPVVDGIPILMAPEMLAASGRFLPLDTAEDPYREAYEEMDFYNVVAANAGADLVNSDAYQIVDQVLDAGQFPDPAWLDATYDLSSQADAYAFVSPIKDMSVLQLGGSGIHAVKFLLAGARESWLLTPMLGEAIVARELAAAFGVGHRFRSVVGIAEQMPFADSSFERVYSGGCIHHTMTEHSIPEIHRILAPTGKFAAIEPWRAPLYSFGIRVFGKQERGVNCRPMDLERTSPIFRSFDQAVVTHHGAFTRYMLIALGKIGFRPRKQTIARITRIDDALASTMSLRKYGSSVAFLADKSVGR